MEERSKMSTDDRRLDAELRRQLDVLRNEETPQRLLVLARELQELLRQRDSSE